MRLDFRNGFLDRHGREGFQKLESRLPDLEISISYSYAPTCASVERKSIPLSVNGGCIGKPHGLITSLLSGDYPPCNVASFLQSGFIANTL